MQAIDPELLSIGNDEYTGQRASPEGKYDALFRSMKSGQCIKCEPQEIGRITNALRKWLQVNKRDDKFEVRSMARYHTDQRGRVWMLAKEQQLKKVA